MCISALELEVDLIKLDMYQKYEHKKPWFVKVMQHDQNLWWLELETNNFKQFFYNHGESLVQWCPNLKYTFCGLIACLASCLNNVWNMKALEGAFNQ